MKATGVIITAFVSGFFCICVCQSVTGVFLRHRLTANRSTTSKNGTADGRKPSEHGDAPRRVRRLGIRAILTEKKQS